MCACICFSFYQRVESTSFGTGLMTEHGTVAWTHESFIMHYVCPLFLTAICVRYPLGRVIGGTVYPGLTLTAGTMWWYVE
jgi:hypothetical protein